MNLLDNKVLLREFGGRASLLNTLNGGIASALATLTSTDEGLIFEVRLPSVSPDALGVFVHQRHLLVRAELTDRDEYATDLPMPLYFQSFPLPPVADTDHIEVFYEEATLRILVPFQQPADPRRIPIKRNT